MTLSLSIWYDAPYSSLEFIKSNNVYRNNHQFNSITAQVVMICKILTDLGYAAPLMTECDCLSGGEIKNGYMYASVNPNNRRVYRV